MMCTQERFCVWHATLLDMSGNLLLTLSAVNRQGVTAAAITTTFDLKSIRCPHRQVVAGVGSERPACRVITVSNTCNS